MRHKHSLHLLATLNLSNPSNPEADSGYIFLRSLLRTVLDMETDWKVTLLCQSGIPPIHPRVALFPYLRAVSKYQSRYDFPWIELANILKEEADNFDLLYSNHPELTANLLALIQTLRGSTLPSVTYIHYLATLGSDVNQIHFDPSLNDWDIGHSILLRQCEVFLLVNRVVVGSRYAWSLLTDIARKTLRLEIDAPIQVIPPSLDRVPEVAVTSPRSEGNPILVYNHRLYSHYGTNQILDWLIAFNTKYPGSFQMVATDPTHGRSAERNQLDSSVNNVRERLATIPFASIRHASSREAYWSLLAQASIGLAPLRDAPLWSMAAVDIMAAGRPLLAPNRGPFPEMVGNCNELLYDSQKDFEHKLWRLLSKPLHWHEMAQQCLQQSHLYTEAVIGHHFRNLFLEVANEQQTPHCM